MRLIDADALKADAKMGHDCNTCQSDWKKCQYEKAYPKMDVCAWIDDAPNITIDELKEAANRLGYNLVKKPQKTGRKKPCPVCGRRPRIYYNYFTFERFVNSSIDVECPNNCIPKIVSKRNVKCIDENGNERIKRLTKHEVEAEATRLWNEEVEKYEREMGTDSV